MKLTLQTDYALRILISLAEKPDQLHSVGDVAKRFLVSKNHLMKTAQILSTHGYIKTERGRNGGLKLAVRPSQINIGAIVKLMEPNMHMAECFQKSSSSSQCALLPNCKLKGVLHEALSSFMSVLEDKTLADIISEQSI